MIGMKGRLVVKKSGAGRKAHELCGLPVNSLRIESIAQALWEKKQATRGEMRASGRRKGEGGGKSGEEEKMGCESLFPSVGSEGRERWQCYVCAVEVGTENSEGRGKKTNVY